MSGSASDPWTLARVVERVAVAIVLGLGVWMILKICWVVGWSIDYPFELEWMEGGFVETVERLLDGGNIYPQPSLEFTGYIYPPLYFLASAGSAAIFGVDFFALRLVSVIATVAVAWLVGRLVYEETGRQQGSGRWGFIGATLFLATHQISGRWFHIARVDTLYIALMLGSLLLLRFRTGTRSAVFAGVIMAAAFFTKQTTAVALLPAGLVLLWIAPRRTLVAGLVGAALVGVTLLGLHLSTEGWYWYYTVEVPGKHPWAMDKLLGFWQNDLRPMYVTLGMAVFTLFLLLARDRRRDASGKSGALGDTAHRPRATAGSDAAFWLAVMVGMMGSAWLSRVHSGGWTNVVMPAFVVAAIVAPIGASILERRLAPEDRRRLGGSPTAAGLAALFAIQLALLSYNPARSIPPEDAEDRANHWLAYLSLLPGDVLVPDYRWLPKFADKTSYGMGMAFADLTRVEDPADRGRQLLNAEFDAAIAAKRFGAIILTDEFHPLVHRISRFYRLQRVVDLAPRPVVGASVTPKAIYVPR